MWLSRNTGLFAPDLQLVSYMAIYYSQYETFYGLNLQYFSTNLVMISTIISINCPNPSAVSIPSGNYIQRSNHFSHLTPSPKDTQVLDLYLLNWDGEQSFYSILIYLDIMIQAWLHSIQVAWCELGISCAVLGVTG